MLSDWTEVLMEGPGKWLLLGAVVLAGPPAARRLRPLAKAAIKSYLSLRDRTRDLRRGSGDTLRDLYASPRSG